ncbi:unnamed protein product, partial [Staurois parvus]
RNLRGSLLGTDHQGTDHQCPDDRCRSPALTTAGSRHVRKVLPGTGSCQSRDWQPIIRALMISALMIGAQQRNPPVPPTCAQQCRPPVPSSAPTCAQ